MEKKRILKRKKFIEIAEKIKNDIVIGVYKIGDPIPTLKELSEQFNANPQTINKAVLYLSNRGYLTSRQGARSLVSNTKSKNKNKIIAMLVDKEKSELINQDNSMHHHCKGIYMSYLKLIAAHDLKSRYLIFNEEIDKIDEALKNKLKDTTGLIVQGTLPESYYKYLEANKIPVVSINRKPPKGVKGRIGNVNIPYNKLYEITNLLIAMGHKKILYGFSKEFDPCNIYSEKLEYIKNAINNWPNHEGYDLIEFSFEPNNSEDKNRLLKLISEGCSAAVCYNDVSALRLYPFLSDLNIKIPYDFSVVGFGDIFSSQIAVPPLTTVKVDLYNVVKDAFYLLEELINQQDNIYIERVAQSELVIRNSTYQFKS